MWEHVPAKKTPCELNCKMCKTFCILVSVTWSWYAKWSFGMISESKTGKNWPSVNWQTWGKGWGGGTVYIHLVWQICSNFNSLHEQYQNCKYLLYTMSFQFWWFTSQLPIYQFWWFTKAGFWWQEYMSVLNSVTTRTSFSTYLFFISGWPHHVMLPGVVPPM